jgi:transposase InsO family protein
MLWVSDFTYVATWPGFVYVAFVIASYARRIVGSRVSRIADAGVVLDPWSRPSMMGIFRPRHRSPKPRLIDAFIAAEKK